jgi:hypothetical protein
MPQFRIVTELLSDESASGWESFRLWDVYIHLRAGFVGRNFALVVLQMR